MPRVMSLRARAAWWVLGVACVAAGLVACEPDVLTRSFGARCSDGRDCDPPADCLPSSDHLPGGMCTWACTDDHDCPSSAACVHAEPTLTQTYCLFECRDVRDCEFLQRVAGDGSWACLATDAASVGETRFVCIGPTGN